MGEVGEIKDVLLSLRFRDVVSGVPAFEKCLNVSGDVTLCVIIGFPEDIGEEICWSG